MCNKVQELSSYSNNRYLPLASIVIQVTLSISLLALSQDVSKARQDSLSSQVVNAFLLVFYLNLFIAWILRLSFFTIVSRLFFSSNNLLLFLRGKDLLLILLDLEILVAFFAIVRPRQFFIICSLLQRKHLSAQDLICLPRFCPLLANIAISLQSIDSSTSSIQRMSSSIRFFQARIVCLILLYLLGREKSRCLILISRVLQQDSL